MSYHEQWRVIPEYPDYEASSYGRIRRAVPDCLGRNAGLIKKTSKLPTGTWQVRVSRDGVKGQISVSKTICSVFHGPSSDDTFCAMHIDGDMDNNRENNLKWAPFSEIMAHMKERGVYQTKLHGPQTCPQSYQFGVRHKDAKLDPQKVREIRASEESPMVLARRYGVTYQSINSVRERKTWKGVS